VWEVDRDLSLSIGESAVVFAILIPFSHDPADSELSSYTKTKAADDCAGSEVCKLISVVSDILLSAIIAIYESSIRLPRMRRLVLELFAVRVEVADPALDFTIDSIFDLRTCSEHFGYALANILLMSVLLRRHCC
jgi:hypothetical protein